MSSFDRLYKNLKNSEQIMGHSVDTLEKVVADLRQAEDDTVSSSFSAMLDEGPKPAL